MAMTRFAALGAACLVFLGIGVTNASATSAYPTRPLDLIVRFGTGGGADVMAREFAAVLHEQHPHIVVRVFDLPGANSLRAVNHIMGLPADGYSLLEVDATIPLLQVEKKTSYTSRDFDEICQVDSDAIVYAARPDDKRFPNAKAMIAYASQHPVSIATTANGSSAELATWYASHLLGLKARDIGYGHPGERITTILGGHVDLIAENWGALASLFKSGKLRPLLVLSPTPIGGYSNVPISREVGLNFTWGQVRGFAVKHGTPAAIEARLRHLCQGAADAPAFKAFLAQHGEGGFEGYLDKTAFLAVMIHQEALFEQVLKALAASPGH